MGRYILGENRKKDRRWPYVILFLVSIVSVVGFAYEGSLSRDQPAASVAVAPLVRSAGAAPFEQPKITSLLPWPSYGQAAYGASDDGVLAQSSKDSKPVPIASLAKVITALVILDKKPLSLGGQGPAIKLTEKDVALYQEYVAKDGTVVPVRAGEQLSQYQALQAMLLPSANNIADTLAIWAFGSVESYNEYANNLLKQRGFIKTTVADASGYSPMSKSTADEMVKVGILYLQNPVLRQIASQTEADIPYAGRIYSYHAAINKDGVIGLKIGYTEEAGRTFLAADIKDEAVDEISVAAVLGASSTDTLYQDVKSILESGVKEHDLLENKSL